MDFFNIPSELSKANSPAYKSGLLKLYAKGGFTGRSDYKRSIENDIRVGMYEDGGRKQPLIRPSARLNFVNPSGGVGYQADLNRGPLSVGLRGYTDVMHPLETELSPSVGLHGRMGDINASYNFAQNQANFNARLGGDKFSLMGNAHLDQGNLVHADLNSRYQVTPDLSFQGNINWDPRAPHPLGYNLGVSYRKKFAEGGEMEETGVSPKPFNPPKKNIRKVPFPSTEAEFMNTYGTMVKLPENFDSILKYYSASRRPSHLEVYEQDCIVAGTCGPNTKTFINPIFTTIVPPITTPPKPPIPKPPIPKPPKPTPPKPTPPLPKPVDIPVPVKETEKSSEIVSIADANPTSPRITGVPSNEVYYLDRGAAPIDPRTGQLNLKRLYNPGNYAGQRYDKEGNKINAQGVRMENGGLIAFNEGGEMDDDPPKSYMLPSRPSQLAASARQIANRNTQESTRIVRPQFTVDDLSQIQEKEEQRKNLAAVRSMQPATEALQRKMRIEDANKALEESLTTSNNWQQLLARQTQATGDKLDVPFIPNWIDPFYMIGSMASNLGAAPYNIQQGNYGQAAWSVAAPVLTGALAGIGAKSTGQFANNLFNPLAGLDLTYKRPPFFPVKEGIAVAKNTIENAGGKIIQDLKSPEGLKRLRAQFKQANPNFTEAQLDHLVETRLEEISDAVIFNKPSHLNESIERLEHLGGGLDDIPSEVIQSHFPVGNAHFSTSSPFAHTERYPSSKLFPEAQMRKDAKIAFGRELPLLPEEKFTDPVFLPGSLTLGKGFETNVGVLDHEIAHAMQKSGFMPIDTELSKVLPKNTETVIDPITGEYSFIDKRNWFEKTLFPYSEETLRHKAYFDDAGLRTVSNERFPFAVEQRRSMIDKGILKDRYDKITPYKLFQARLAANKIGGNRVVQNDRVVGFTPWWKYGELAKAMNKMPAVIPPAAVLGAAATQEYEKGGMQGDPPKSYMLPSRPSQLAPSPREVASRNTQESTKTMPQNFTPQQRAAAIPRQSNVVGALDIASDVMRLGKYIPHPVAQAIGNAGTLLGNGIDMYQGINYLNQGNYKDAAANAIMSKVGKTGVLGAGFELAHDISNYEKGGLQLFGKGGYRVVRTSERKGKTHKVIGPGGKVKYFGDPSMGERSKSKYGKEAFYKRHAKNLKANPYFRAYARATWSEGGIVRDVEPFNLSSY